MHSSNVCTKQSYTYYQLLSYTHFNAIYLCLLSILVQPHITFSFPLFIFRPPLYQIYILQFCY